jgi:hypothetical protein
MKIIDQKLLLSTQHYARSESTQQRLHENYINGQLQSRETHTQLRVSENAGTSSVAIGNWDSQTHRSTPPHNPPSVHQHDSMRPANRPENTQARDVQPPQREAFPAHAQIGTTQKTDSEKVSLPPHLQRMIEAIEAMMERLTGKPYQLKVYGYHHNEDTSSPSAPPPLNNTTAPQGTPALGQRWAIMSHYYEEQHTRFSAQGSITTAKGEQIHFDLNLQMSRTFSQQFMAERQQGWVMKDPLTVNFGGTPAELTLEKYQFDIDADGQTDSISFVAPGSGFLALDKNGDGLINDGRELFGALSGDGFSDLAAYDEDGNGWIDENDTIFSKLQVWHKDANGLDRLQGLLELNIGAIALANLATPFDFKDAHNNLQGQLKSSGVFLYEDGQGAGSLQQIDLAV